MSLRAQPLSGSRCPTRHARRAGGLQPYGSATLGSWPCSAPCAPGSAPIGFTNRSLRARVTGLLGAAYTTNQMSYDLARLRLNGLIERLPSTPTPTSRPPTGSASRSSTPNCTTGCSARCLPPTSPPPRHHYEKRCAPSTLTSHATHRRRQTAAQSGLKTQHKSQRPSDQGSLETRLLTSAGAAECMGSQPCGGAESASSGA